MSSRIRKRNLIAVNPEIYGFPHSPFCIAVETALEALQVDFTRRPVENWDRSEILNLTGGAYYEVPVLVCGSEIIFESSGDSQDVAHYIDRNLAKGQLFPALHKGHQELIIHFLENEVEGVTFRLFDPHYIDSISDIGQRGMVIRHKERKFGRGCVDEWKRHHAQLLTQTEQLLSPLNNMLGNREFLLGSAPVYADFLLAGILGNLTFGGFHSIPANLPHLERFHRDIRRFRF